MKFDTLLLTFLCQFFEYIPLERSRIYDIVVRFFRIKHREAVVVTARDGDVLGTRRLDLRHPFCRIELGRIESRSQFGILVAMDVAVIHVPLAPSRHAVDAPMKKDTELVVLKFLASLQVFGSRYISLCLGSHTGT